MTVRARLTHGCGSPLPTVMSVVDVIREVCRATSTSNPPAKNVVFASCLLFKARQEAFYLWILPIWFDFGIF